MLYTRPTMRASWYDVLYSRIRYFRRFKLPTLARDVAAGSVLFGFVLILLPLLFG